ncbi:MAG: hypothetical protein MR357_00755 [Anaeroplasma sp.]|nr:hypothetical protein [Anaeroplasma sp.]
MICDIENIIEKIISSIEQSIIPLNRNISEGIIESDNALNTLFLFQQIIQIIQYIITKKLSIIR